MERDRRAKSFVRSTEDGTGQESKEHRKRFRAEYRGGFVRSTEYGTRPESTEGGTGPESKSTEGGTGPESKEQKEHRGPEEGDKGTVSRSGNANNDDGTKQSKTKQINHNP